jgi:methionyl-tRNA formyltransferase
MSISEVALLFAPTYRSRAYAQLMRMHGLLPRQAIYLSGNEPDWDGLETIRASFSQLEFNPGEHARDTLISAGVKVIDVPSTDVNSENIIREITRIDAPIIVYSGPSGALLRPPILKTGKKFLHIHGGIAPQYRGSTAFYYSILREGTLGATALYLDKEIDTGPIIKCKSYKPEEHLEIDRLLDPLVRADLLIDILKLIADGDIPKGTIQDKGGTTYYVMHPVLKHLAIRKAKS